MATQLDQIFLEGATCKLLQQSLHTDIIFALWDKMLEKRTLKGFITFSFLSHILQQYLPDFVKAVWTLLTSTANTVKHDLVSQLIYKFYKIHSLSVVTFHSCFCLSYRSRCLCFLFLENEALVIFYINI